MHGCAAVKHCLCCNCDAGVFQYLHENGVVHRDLKPENLLYADLSLDAPLKIGKTSRFVQVPVFVRV